MILDKLEKKQCFLKEGETCYTRKVQQEKMSIYKMDWMPKKLGLCLSM